MTDLKQKLSGLLSPMGAGNNAYELGQLAQQQAELIKVLLQMVKRAKALKEINSVGNQGYELALDDALKAAKEVGYL